MRTVKSHRCRAFVTRGGIIFLHHQIFNFAKPCLLFTCTQFEMEHIHFHQHADGHHNHEHEDKSIPAGKWHSHTHKHNPLAHEHPHFPDLHHRHGHD